MSNPTLELNGDLTIARAGEIRQFLLDAFQRPSQSLTIDVSRVANIDIFGLQILCSAHRFADKLGRTFQITGTPSAFFCKALQVSSYGSRTDCTLAPVCLCSTLSGGCRG